MTGVISQKHWSWELTYIDRTDQLNICVILDLGWFLIGKKRRAIIVMNENAYVWTIRRYKTLNFFQPNIKTYPKLCMTAEIRLQYRIINHRTCYTFTFTLNVIFPKCWNWEHVTDCPDDDTAGKDDQSQREIGRRYRREETEQRYAILEYAICMTTLRIVKTIFEKGTVQMFWNA